MLFSAWCFIQRIQLSYSKIQWNRYCYNIMFYSYVNRIWIDIQKHTVIQNRFPKQEEIKPNSIKSTLNIIVSLCYIKLYRVPKIQEIFYICKCHIVWHVYLKILLLKVKANSIKVDLSILKLCITRLRLT